jgi:hypothetical protein
MESLYICGCRNSCVSRDANANGIPQMQMESHKYLLLLVHLEIFLKLCTEFCQNIQSRDICEIPFAYVDKSVEVAIDRAC